MASRLKARKASRGRSATAVRSGRRDAPRGSARVTPKQTAAPGHGTGRVVTRPRRGQAVVQPVGKRDLKEFRRLLEEERKRLVEALEALEEHTPELERQVGVDLTGSYDENFADVAGDTFEREKGLAIESSVQALLIQVEEALVRVDAGSYGTCEDCGRSIHQARLRAIPYAKLCIECKAKEERANGLGRA